MGRIISKEFINDLQSGVLSPLMKIIKGDNELIICFRDGYASVYYKSHSILNIKEQTNNYKFTFDLGHARYFDTFVNVKKELEALNIEATKTKKEDKFTAVFYVKKNRDIEFDFQTIINTYKKYEESFYIPGQTNDLFTLRKTKKTSPLREKRHQQVLFKMHQNLSICNGLLFYDMELSLPKPKRNSIEEKDVIKECGKHITGAPDCLAVKLENGMVKKIVLVEVKSTRKACNGNNGILKHDKDFNDIIKCSYYRNFIVESMRETLKLYERLGICSKVIVPEQLGEHVKDFEVLYFFTHEEVIDWTVNSRNDSKNNLKKYKELYNSNPDMFRFVNDDMKQLMGKEYN